jgi:putative flippase GtrA
LQQDCFTKSWHFKITGTTAEVSSLAVFVGDVYFVMMAFVFQTKEHRHMLAAYPAIAIASAYVLNRLHTWLKSLSVTWRWLGADEMLIILLLVATRISAGAIMEVVLRTYMLILKPF